MIYTIQNDKLSVSVDTFGAQVMSVLSSDGYEYIWQGGEWWPDRCPVLFPTCGNLPTRKYTYRGGEYKLPIHGIAMYREFVLKEQDATRLVFALSSDEQTRSSYPFDFVFEVEFRIDGNKLFTTLTPKNTCDRPMPYMTGWHPGFNLWGDYAIEEYAVNFGDKELDWYPIPAGGPIAKYPEKHALDNGKYFLNEEEIYKNDTMIFENYSKSFTLEDGDGNARIAMKVSENLPFFCIWKEASSEARFVCLEPWNNIFNSDGTTEDFEKKKMATLMPGESESYTYEVTFN